MNALAGGGSFLTVPLLVMAGLPPTFANATNRVGVLFQTIASWAGFRRGGIPSFESAHGMIPGMALGAWLGAYVAAHAPEALLGRLFGVLMLLFLPVLLSNPKPRGIAPGLHAAGPWKHLVFLAIGLYAGAVQAGLGVLLLVPLVGIGGLDLVRANAAKVAINAMLTSVALLQFVWAGKVMWLHGFVLAMGMGVGGYVGSHVGVRFGPRFIRPVLAVTVVALALRLLVDPDGS